MWHVGPHWNLTEFKISSVSDMILVQISTGKKLAKLLLAIGHFLDFTFLVRWKEDDER